MSFRNQSVGVDSSLLAALFLSCESISATAHLEQTVRKFIHNEAFLDNYHLSIVTLQDGELPPDPMAAIAQMRALLTLILADPDSQEAIDLAKEHRSYPFWEGFQLGSALADLNLLLIGTNQGRKPIFQFPSGAVSLESEGYWLWGQSPHQLFHAELGVYWYLIGELTEDHTYTDAANQLADWHHNLLDEKYLPLQGMFSRESEGGMLMQLPYLYLLFRTAHLLGRQSHFGDIANQLGSYLVESSIQATLTVPSHLVMLEQWVIKKGASLSTIPYNLQKQIYDPHTCLVGCRDSDRTAICTHFGGRTGLGAYRVGDVEWVTYGPQHLPLEESEHFGIEGVFSDAVINSGPQSFSIESYVLVASREGCLDSWANYGQGDPAQVWIELRQQYENKIFNIDVQFLGVEISPNLAFCFYVKANSCLVGQGKELKSHTLDRYDGNVERIILLGDERKMIIEIQEFNGSLQVIPLPGNQRFWGACFLIALVNPGSQKFTIKSTAA